MFAKNKVPQSLIDAVKQVTENKTKSENKVQNEPTQQPTQQTQPPQPEKRGHIMVTADRKMIEQARKYVTNSGSEPFHIKVINRLEPKIGRL